VAARRAPAGRANPGRGGATGDLAGPAALGGPVCDDPCRGQGRSSAGRSTLTPAADRRGEPAPRTPGGEGQGPQADDGLPPRATDAVEVDRVVPPSGNPTIWPQQFWLGPQRARQIVTFWIDTTTMRLRLDGVRLKTQPPGCRSWTWRGCATVKDGSRDRRRPHRHRPRWPVVPLSRSIAPSTPAVWSAWPARVQVGYPLAGQRITLRLEEQLVRHRRRDAAAQPALTDPARRGGPDGQRQQHGQPGRLLVPVGAALIGRRVTIRLDGELMHVIADGVLARSWRYPVPAEQHGRRRPSATEAEHYRSSGRAPSETWEWPNGSTPRPSCSPPTTWAWSTWVRACSPWGNGPICEARSPISSRSPPAR